jgi:hypothetical protein
MGTTPVCTIDATGIHRPTLATCLAYFVNGYQGIYGTDVSLGSDTQDGELMGLLGAAVDDCNAETVSAYNAYSPATAQGAGLSSNVKINGLARKVPTYSSVPVLVVGQVTLAVPATQCSDGSGNVWSFGAVTIPSAGQITVTATCQTLGAVALGTGVALTIMNPTRGLQSVTTTSIATPGAPIELDAALRNRQANAVQMPSQTMLGSIVGALWTITGVARMRPYQNDTDAPDGNGIPGNSIALVIEGGDAQTIANAISLQKFAAGTYGSTTETVIDAVGVSHAINFSYAIRPPIKFSVDIHPGPQYSTNTGGLIQVSFAAWVNALGIGNSIQLTRAMAAGYLSPSIAATATALQAAYLANDTASILSLTSALASLNAAAQTYEVMALRIARNSGSPTAADVTIAWNEDAMIAVNSDWTLVNPASVVVNLV